MFTKPPIIFPLVALFHLLMSILAISSLYPTPFIQIDWIRPLTMVLFTILSFGICFLKKWVAMAYVAISMLSFGLLYFNASDPFSYLFGHAMFPFNLIVSIFILILFKKLK